MSRVCAFHARYDIEPVASWAFLKKVWISLELFGFERRLFCQNGRLQGLSLP